jgi:hypothetical protein
MPRTSAKTTRSGRVNKSAWIRSQAASLPAKEVVAKAKQHGIELSIAQVYTARSTAAKSGTSAATVAPSPRSPAAATARTTAAPPPAAKLHGQFVQLVLRIGTDEAQKLLARLG